MRTVLGLCLGLVDLCPTLIRLKTKKKQRCHLYRCAFSHYLFNTRFWMSELFFAACCNPARPLETRAVGLEVTYWSWNHFPFFLRSSSVSPLKVRGIPQALWKDLGRACWHWVGFGTRVKILLQWFLFFFPISLSGWCNLQGCVVQTHSVSLQLWWWYYSS